MHFRFVFTIRNQMKSDLIKVLTYTHALMEDITLATYLTPKPKSYIKHQVQIATISSKLLKETAEVTAPILKLIFERSFIGHR